MNDRAGPVEAGGPGVEDDRDLVRHRIPRGGAAGVAGWKAGTRDRNRLAGGSQDGAGEGLVRAAKHDLPLGVEEESRLNLKPPGGLLSAGLRHVEHQRNWSGPQLIHQPPGPGGRLAEVDRRILGVGQVRRQGSRGSAAQLGHSGGAGLADGLSGDAIDRLGRDDHQFPRIEGLGGALHLDLEIKRVILDIDNVCSHEGV